ncbi:MAG: HlyD family efflux transporter periplasmic adaptor subunit [Megasphaera sp.]|jgi:HlyD family secretion protein|nr:HlyD family efflux transporter periplasmic adaptor subunit [Megasphaera sp.]MCH4188270.1 HlyD family efflux transporter periplasmic adaptor subunit [Megasphaera sp.]MCH4218040.1 HlyD family efflux transporter periplasmic adaptor subunit [Megasphaera sp.]
MKRGIHKGLAVVMTLMMLVICLVSAGCSGSTTASQETWGRADAKEIDINSKISGRVVQLNVKEGDTVKQGQLLAIIDQRDLLTKKAQAEANIKTLEAQQTQASYTTTMQSGTTQSALGQAQAAQQKAETSLRLAKADYERYASLLDSGAVSKQVYDQYRTNYEAAQAAYDQSGQAVDQANSTLMTTDVNKANEAAAAQKLEQAQAALQEIEVSLSETEIRAPFDGIITEKYIEEGSMISTGTPLVAVQDPTDNWVDVKVPETELSKYHLNQAVTLRARDGKTTVTGTITDISQKAEFATSRATSERGDDTDIISFNVKVQVNAAALRPGMRFQIVGDAS